jgi:hypothetical protein
MHRFGQEQEQPKRWGVILNESYDTSLQANTAAKFSAQLSGEGDMSAGELTDISKGRLILEAPTFSDLVVDLLLHQLSNDQNREVADTLTQRLLGQRCSSLGHA